MQKLSEPRCFRSKEGRLYRRVVEIKMGESISLVLGCLFDTFFDNVSLCKCFLLYATSNITWNKSVGIIVRNHQVRSDGADIYFHALHCHQTTGEIRYS